MVYDVEGMEVVYQVSAERVDVECALGQRGDDELEKRPLMDQEEGVVEPILACWVEGVVGNGQVDVVYWELYGYHWTVEIKTKQK